MERDDDLDSCSLLLNNKSTPLLQPGGSGSHTPDNKVLVQLSVGHPGLFGQSNHISITASFPGQICRSSISTDLVQAWTLLSASEPSQLEDPTL